MTPQPRASILWEAAHLSIPFGVSKEAALTDFVTIESIVVALVLVTTLVAIGARRLRLPYTVSLVLMGLLIAFLTPLELEATPDLILAIFVPPLVFEAAFHLELKQLRQNLVPILFLAVPGVLLTTMLVGGMTAVGAGVAFGTAAVFGALIAATDPVAVVSLFRALGSDICCKGHDGRQRSHDQPVMKAGNELGRDPAHHQPHRNPAQRNPEEIIDPRQRVKGSGHHRRQCDLKYDNGRAIVEQALALDGEGQLSWDA